MKHLLRPGPGLRRLARALLLCGLALGLGGLGAASAEPKITLTGPDQRGPITADAQGRFAFPDAQLRKNSVNKFTVTAKDDAGKEYSKEINITQLSLESVVVARVRAEPLPPERIFQLVNDGVIDIQDPANFNVSLFQIVLTIGQQEIPIEIPIGTGVKEEMGYENIPSINDPGNGGSNSNPPDTEIIVFDKSVPCDSCAEPPRIPGVIVIEGRIKSLKEFFSVRLLLMNMSGLFTLSDLKASVEFPNGGLSNTLPVDGMAVFDDIGPGNGDVPGQAEREFIIRGDEIGTQPIRVNFGGKVRGGGIPDDEPIPFNGSADTSVEVKGPPEFLVRVSHPDHVDAGIPYELKVEITNNGQAPALYASLDLDIGGDAEFVSCQPPTTPDATPACEDIEGPITRQLQHLLPGQRATESFTVKPKVTGDITSCVGASSQNITLQVLVGSLGCLTGKIPSTRGVPPGVPVVSVLPYPDALGVGIDSPVTAFFSEKINLSTITLGAEGSFRVFDGAGNIAPGKIRTAELNGDTVVIWQLEDGITNRLRGNSLYQVRLTQDIKSEAGAPLYDEWTSQFRTTDPNNDTTPPQLTLGFEPGIDPLRVLPGQLVQMNAYAADQGTGVARVELRLRDQDAADAVEQFVDQKTKFGAEAGPTIFAVDTAPLAPGHTYQLHVTALDRAGNAQDATIPFILVAAPEAPSIVLPEDPAQPVVQGISLPVTPLSVSSAIKTVTFYLDGAVAPFATVMLPPFQASVVTIPLAAGAHSVRAVAADGVGQSAEDTLSFTISANDTPPVIAFTGAVDGAQFVRGARFAVTGSATHATGIEQSAFFLDVPSGVPIVAPGGSVQIDTATLSEGTHRLYLLATNKVGISNNPANPDSFLEFVVKPVPNGPPPSPPVVSTLAAPVNGKVTVAGFAPAGARVDVTNATSGLSTTVYAGADGKFSLQIDAAAGDSIEATVLDVSQSQQASAKATATVPAPRVLTSLQLLPAAVTLVTKNATQALALTAFYQDGGSTNVTSQATYTSSDSTVASVGAAQIAALKSGTATITASFGGLTDTTAVTVNIVTLESITVAPPSVTLAAVGAVRQLVVTGHYSNGTQQVLASGLSFSSSAPAQISVDPSGLVRALTAGSATITVATSGLQPVQVPVQVDSSADLAPTVLLVSPLDGADVQRGDVVSVVAQGTDETGVARIVLTVTGATSASEIRQVSPAQTSTQQTFTFNVAANAAIGGTITVAVQAEDTSGKLSPIVSRTLDVVDVTPPQVSLQAPAPDTLVNYGDVVTVTVSASDAGGVSQLRYVASGAVSASGSQPIAPPQTLSGTSFTFTIPFGVPLPDVTIQAFARDAAGNESASAAVPIKITGADITPPATVATAATAPGSSPISTVTYQVTDGLADLDHVQLFYRRNSIGTFNRYTGPLGTGSGKFTPQSGATGTIAFDSTRMGGDGSYEFFTVGVDKVGNREASPKSGNAIIGDPNATASFAAGAPVVTITSPAEIAGSNFDGMNLRIVGTTVTLVGSHTFGNVELLSGAVLNHRETTQTQGFGIEMTAWTVTVDTTSRIDVVGRGFLGGNNAGLGETAHTVGFTPGAQSGSGGSYGGLGGDYSGNGASVPNPVNGNLVNPVDLGSGGGAFSGAGGDGGGRVLVGAINLVIDGAVTANGGLSAGSASGEGSGGSINFTTRTLSGVGAIAADGGTTNGSNHVGGGGGRIALRFLDRSTYDAAHITARGGDGFYGDGADGTVFLLEEGATNGELVINGSGPGSTFTDLILPPGQVFDSITLQNGARVIAQGEITIAGTLRLTGNSILTHPSASEAGLRINVRDLIVDAGSAVDVTGRGYPGGNNSGFGESGQTLGGVIGAGVGTGGSHGGIGGDYNGNGPNDLPNPLYGDPKHPDRLGAGGGGFSGAGGAGGGRARIIATSSVIVNGRIAADGGLSSGSASGEGAGGSLWIQTSRIGGTGRISADGGNTNGSNHVGGGGGRVALYIDFVDPAATLGDLGNVTAAGGDGFYGDAASGTVFVSQPGQDEGTLRVDGGRTDGNTAPVATTLTAIGPGLAAATTANTLSVDGILRAFTPNALVGLRLNPDLTQTETFAIVSNDGTTITVATPNEHGIAFSSRAGVGKRYAGTWIFDDVDVVHGGFLELPDPLRVEETFALTDASVVTHPETTTTYEGILDVGANTVSIDATSRIDVVGRGYLGGNRTGLGEVAHTLGFAPGAQSGSGGSYAGVGGDYALNGASAPNPVYGSFTDPQDLGAGGGAFSGAGGDGGGRVRLVTNTLIVDGRITADGAHSSGSASGDGAGGSVNLRTGSLSGSGFVTASGGSDNGSNHVGGGGGRIAVRYTGALTLPRTNIRAFGGDGFYGDGGHGSVFFQSAAQPQGELVIDGQGFVPPDNSTVLPGDVTFSNLTLGAGVRAVADQGLHVSGTLRVQSGAVLQHTSSNEFGLKLEVGRLEVDAGGAVDVTGRGYRGGNNSGFGEFGQTLAFTQGSGNGSGGSHGGIGGDYPSSDGVPGSLYGNPKQPITLGAGGGAFSGFGGDGGGALRVIATEAVVVNGALRANGGLSGGSASGDGAGGSIWIDTPLLQGAGTVSADGGNTNGSNHTGGGGGRVAIHANAVTAGNDLNGLRGITALAGDGFYGDGAAGTVFVQLAGQTAGTLYIDGRGSNPWPFGTPPSPMIAGNTVAVTANTLTADGKLRAFVPGGLVGLRLNPDLAQGQSFEIQSNTENLITVITPNQNGVAFATVAAVGKRYGEALVFDAVTTRSGGDLELVDRLTVNGSLSIVENSLLTHAKTTTTYEGGLDLDVGTLNVDATSRIDVSGRGYLGGGKTGGLGETAHTVGFAAGAQNGTGGSYGGLGGDYSGNGASVPNPVYGTASEPVDLGSGGGAFGGNGGDGGGRVKVVADSVVLNGVLRADGALSSGSASGEGSGGSVNLRTGTLAGAGFISANGGTTGGGTHSGGGGGRIAIRHTGANTLPAANLSAAGGDGFYADGQPGSIFVQP